MTTAGLFAQGDAPQGGLQLGDSAAVVLPYDDALNDQTAEFVVVIKVELITKQSGDA
jgi:hypothetical protein